MNILAMRLLRLLAGFAAGATSLMAAQKPNIIVIYTDDQGFGDTGFLNPAAKFKTPHMDRLAREGIAFTNAHCADTVCTPSRYGLLTGRYSWRTSLKTGVFEAEGACLIKDGRTTLASLLRDQGYHTGMVGKWHLGMVFPGAMGQRDWTQPVQDMPLDKGFDYFYGVPSSLNFGVLAWFEGRYAKTPPTLYTSKKKNDRHVDYRIMPPYREQPGGSENRKNPAAEVEVAPDFVDNECLSRFTDRAIAWMRGKAADAKNGRPFFLYLPFTAPHYPVCPLPEFQGQGNCGAYGEFVIETDHRIGQILAFLEQAGLDQNTLIVFTSDNGPENSWKQRIADFQHHSSGPYRGGKRDIYEGGHRIPFFVRWPAGIKAPGRTWPQLVGQTDLLATVAEIVGAPLPENAGEDSQSFASVLFEAAPRHARLPLINHGAGGRFAITEGNWKLILPHGGQDAELYDLGADPGETTNVIARHADTAATLQRKVTAIVANGRTTPGKAQANDTGWWKDLTWMKPDALLPRPN